MIPSGSRRVGGSARWPRARLRSGRGCCVCIARRARSGCGSAPCLSRATVGWCCWRGGSTSRCPRSRPAWGPRFGSWQRDDEAAFVASRPGRCGRLSGPTRPRAPVLGSVVLGFSAPRRVGRFRARCGSSTSSCRLLLDDDVAYPTAPSPSRSIAGWGWDPPQQAACLKALHRQGHRARPGGRPARQPVGFPSVVQGRLPPRRRRPGARHRPPPGSSFVSTAVRSARPAGGSRAPATRAGVTPAPRPRRHGTRQPIERWPIMPTVSSERSDLRMRELLAPRRQRPGRPDPLLGRGSLAPDAAGEPRSSRSPGRTARPRRRRCWRRCSDPGRPTFRTSGNENTGLPLTLNVLRVRPWHRFAVIEIGVGAPGEMRRLARLVRPDVALVLAVLRTHTKAFPDRETHAREKAILLRGLAARRGGGPQRGRPPGGGDGRPRSAAKS